MERDCLYYELFLYLRFPKLSFPSLQRRSLVSWNWVCPDEAYYGSESE